MISISTKTRKIRNVTLLGLFSNLLLSSLKFVFGYLGKSSALIADGVHSLSDLSTDIAVIYGTAIASRPIDKSHDYGHGKFETVSTLFIGVILILVGGGILRSGVSKILSITKGLPIEAVHPYTAYIAALSIVVKELLYHYSLKWGNILDSSALQANAVHHRSDAFSSIGVLIGISGAVILGSKWMILDPAAAIIVSLLIFYSGGKIILENLKELTETSLCDEKEENILEIVKNIPGVHDPHSLRTRKIGNIIAVDIHIRVDRDLSVLDGHEIASRVENELKDALGQETIIYVHMDPY